jgi:hypothetical protein
MAANQNRELSIALFVCFFDKASITHIHFCITTEYALAATHATKVAALMCCHMKLYHWEFPPKFNAWTTLYPGMSDTLFVHDSEHLLVLLSVVHDL